MQLSVGVRRVSITSAGVSITNRTVKRGRVQLVTANYTTTRDPLTGDITQTKHDKSVTAKWSVNTESTGTRKQESMSLTLQRVGPYKFALVVQGASRFWLYQFRDSQGIIYTDKYTYDNFANLAHFMSWCLENKL